jgi:hypothetical protein|tara:strand:+ start:306 stop:530 length:225 start_codon:yes stop_codon:yes gene_type:complete
MTEKEILNKLAKDKTLQKEIKDKGENDLEVKIKILEKEVDTLKAVIDLKDVELNSKDVTIKKLKKDAEDMLLYP